MLLLHVENTKSPYRGRGDTPLPPLGHLDSYENTYFLAKILIFFFFFFFFFFFYVRILKLENQTWQLCTSQYNLDLLPNPHKYKAIV